MDLNTAKLEVMAKVVGLELAYDLLLWRPYLSWEEVAEIPGLTEAHLNDLRSAGAVVKLPWEPRTRRDEANRGREASA